MTFTPIRNVNHFAEELRDQVFVCAPTLIGGFDCFTLCPDFYQLFSSDSLHNSCLDIFARYCYGSGEHATLISRSNLSVKEYQESINDIKKSIKVFKAEDVIVAWYWNGVSYHLLLVEGDTAAITHNSGGGTWQWVKWHN